MGVLAYEIHYLVGIDLECLADTRNFVGERDLEGMESITCVLEHLGRTDRADPEVASQVSEDLANHRYGAIGVPANDGVGGIFEVANRGSLAKEFGLKAHAKVLATLLPRLP